MRVNIIQFDTLFSWGKLHMRTVSFHTLPT